MEHKTAALIFPETEPSAQTMAKFLLFFDALSYYMPTEAGAANIKDNSFFTTLFTGNVPAPLGEDLSRFNRLLREMETSRPEEISRLFSAAKALLVTGQARDRDETSSSSVFSAMQKDADTKTSTLYKERLWQARLILKLAEMLDRREAEVRQGLAQVSSVEQKVFASLEGLGEGETDDPAELHDLDKLLHPKGNDVLPVEPSPGTSGLLIPLRLKAWAELYLADSSDLHPLVLVAVNPESGAILLDNYENIWRKEPVKLFSLSIPGLSHAGTKEVASQFLAARNAFREEAREILGFFAGFLQKTATSPGSPISNQEEPAQLVKNISAWEHKLKNYFPGTETGSKKLVFYCLPGTSFTGLFQRLFHLEGPFSAGRREHPTGLLAILES